MTNKSDKNSDIRNQIIATIFDLTTEITRKKNVTLNLQSLSENTKLGIELQNSYLAVLNSLEKELTDLNEKAMLISLPEKLIELSEKVDKISSFHTKFTTLINAIIDLDRLKNGSDSTDMLKNISFNIKELDQALLSMPQKIVIATITFFSILFSTALGAAIGAVVGFLVGLNVLGVVAGAIMGGGIGALKGFYGGQKIGTKLMFATNSSFANNLHKFGSQVEDAAKDIAEQKEQGSRIRL
jgi:hypothetical protein